MEGWIGFGIDLLHCFDNSLAVELVGDSFKVDRSMSGSIPALLVS